MVAREATRPRGRSNSRWGGGRYAPRRRFCSFCANKIEEIDYKNITLLRGYISDRGKINPRRRTGTCARHQRALAMAIKRARHLALLPYAPEHIHCMGDVASLGTPKELVAQNEKSRVKAVPAAETKSPKIQETPVAEVEEPVEKATEAPVAEVKETAGETAEAVVEESPVKEALADAEEES